ncbi:methyl-accepting chemotaxis protein [Sphingobium sp. B1D7B]|uniref:methyl-accepting chemotaxis protein n=1 Tax=unclassified Sphingobium TaxID=2611147 RepID=UPI00222537B5|nr:MULTISPECIES: methyl-accepting chemotaxis protein [unclassified Sphingobium]MCW2390472.1 methyl-accepting chemotaxis protein [Sphingobium sp. B11D3A]MCW2405613.1 methyl-accepting chemotaxis protein [Sphingobium sp. B1D7B]
MMHAPSFQIDRQDDEDAVARLRMPGSAQIKARQGASSMEIVAVFRQHMGLRLLPLVDEADRPVGAIYEEDVRNILFNPYGYALLSNPGITIAFGERMQRCPVVEMDRGLAGLLAVHARDGGKEAIIVTRGGRYAGFVPNAAIFAAVNAQEVRQLRARDAELTRLRSVSASFEQDIQGLSNTLGDMAALLQRNATGTASRSQDNTDHALHVLTAASQTGAMMDEVARSSAALVRSLGRLDWETEQARTVAAEAVTRVDASAAQAQALDQATQSIETVTATIEMLARSVKLLALNASIEAARAGQAGRGFAVVANEVRALAQQTGMAAQSIRTHAVTVRGTVAAVRNAQAGLEDVIASVKQIADGVTATVSAQRALSLHLAAGTEQAASASKDIEAHIVRISGNARSATEGAQDLARTAHDLSDSSSTLSRRVERFLSEIVMREGGAG